MKVAYTRGITGSAGVGLFLLLLNLYNNNKNVTQSCLVRRTWLILIVLVISFRSRRFSIFSVLSGTHSDSALDFRISYLKFIMVMVLGLIKHDCIIAAPTMEVL